MGQGRPPASKQAFRQEPHPRGCPALTGGGASARTRGGWSGRREQWAHGLWARGRPAGGSRPLCIRAQPDQRWSDPLWSVLRPPGAAVTRRARHHTRLGFSATTARPQRPSGQGKPPRSPLTLALTAVGVHLAVRASGPCPLSSQGVPGPGCQASSPWQVGLGVCGPDSQGLSTPAWTAPVPPAPSAQPTSSSSGRVVPWAGNPKASGNVGCRAQRHSSGQASS